MSASDVFLDAALGAAQMVKKLSEGTAVRQMYSETAQEARHYAEAARILATTAIELSTAGLGHASPAEEPETIRVPVVLTLDGREIYRQTVKYTMQRAARGTSSLVGGHLREASGGE